jgi:hypothetical protein
MEKRELTQSLSQKDYTPVFMGNLLVSDRCDYLAMAMES